jgi:hypothetical protein
VRDKSRWLNLVVGQAYHLHDNHSSSLMLKIQQVYPELWDFVTGKSSAKAKVYTFAEMLDQYSKQSDPRYRIKDLIEHITKTHSAELLWATKEERFEQVLASFVDQCMFDALTNPNFQRSVVFLERQQKDLIEQILALEAGLQPGQSHVLMSSQNKLSQSRSVLPKDSDQKPYAAA